MVLIGSCLTLLMALPALAIILMVFPVSFIVFKGKVFYSQIRVGKGGRRFRLYKLRSMLSSNNKDHGIVMTDNNTVIPSWGRFLRRSRLDELPQLLNVVLRDMNFVGYRPDLPEYYESIDPELERVFERRPGITSLSSILYKNEERLLAGTADHFLYYRDYVYRRKLEIELCYQSKATRWDDFQLLFWTVVPWSHFYLARWKSKLSKCQNRELELYERKEARLSDDSWSVS